MKRLAAVVVLAALASFAFAANKKPTPKPTPAAAKAKAKDDAAMSCIRNLTITQITQTDEQTRVFTATDADGKAYRFSYQKPGELKVGAVVDVTYTGTLGGPKPAMASNLNLSKSNIN